MTLFRPQRTSLFTRLLLLFSLALLFFSAQAIVIRHDKSDSRYRVDENEFPAVFYLHYRFNNKVCVATMISPRWALTAAHCTRQTPILESWQQGKPYDLLVAGESYRLTDLVLHPRSEQALAVNKVDLALLRLDRDVENVTPVPVYRKRDEQGRTVLFVGWGYSGPATRESRSNDGRLRRASNKVMEAERWLKFRFDDPRNRDHEAQALEGVPGLGDSGGPALVDTEDGVRVMGVALGELLNDEDPAPAQGMYGAIELYERVSSYLDWIDSVLAVEE